MSMSRIIPGKQESIILTLIVLGSIAGCGSEIVSTYPSGQGSCSGVSRSQIRSLHESVGDLRDGGLSERTVMREIIDGCSTTACRCVIGIIEDVYDGRSLADSDAWPQTVTTRPPSSISNPVDTAYTGDIQYTNSQSLISTLPGSFLFKSIDEFPDDTGRWETLEELAEIEEDLLAWTAGG